MQVYILFAHPSQKSYSKLVLDAFTQGLTEAGHRFEIGDLYQMKFVSEMNEAQYQREIGMDPSVPVPEDVKREQEKINRADALVFIYPLWWSDCPAKLKGWFDRVLTYGYAYDYDENDQHVTQIQIKKALVICSAGHTEKHLEETGIADSMRKIMLNDRLLGVGVKKAEMVILGGIMPNDDTYRHPNLLKAYQLGKNF
ncbi:MAG: NAD(P)H-dependent oxidoreductase [bacterium]|nr:MAG: NAD(P)H-dependent oxidoreductase [bacterium]